MFVNLELLGWLGLWLGLAALIVTVHWYRRQSYSGLVIAYLLTFGLVHWIGAAMYIFPGSDLLRTYSLTLSGFKQCVYAMAGFAAGSLILAPLLKSSRSVPSTTRLSTDRRIAALYAVMGLFAYPLLITFLGGLPSLTALLSVSQYLVIVGVCLLAWKAWHQDNRGGFWGWVLLAFSFPFITIMTRGFAGYGVVAVIMTLAFIVAFYRPRWRIVPVAILLFYAGLSFYTGYMAERQQIRASVWGGRGIGTRVESVQQVFESAEWFSPTNPAHLYAVDKRLNQNYLVGSAVEHLSASQQTYARGETIWQAAVAIIPRAVWPDKPFVAGSGDLVPRYTGIQFAEGTSVGIGHVMEWYVNFGTMGVVLGFVLLGVVVTWFDMLAGRYLREGDDARFAFWFFPGLSLLNVGGSFVELTTGVAASFAAVWAVNRFVLPVVLGENFRKRRRTSVSSNRSFSHW